MELNGLELSCEVYDLISRYLTLIPRTNSDFNAFYETVYPVKSQPGPGFCNTEYGCGWYEGWKDTYNYEHSEKAIAAGEELLEKYYDEGICDKTSVNPYPGKSTKISY